MTESPNIAIRRISISTAIATLSLLIALATPPLYSQSGGTAAYESPPTLKASDLQPAELLKGPHHTVRKEVTTDGFTNTYVIDSDYGSFAADGDDMLPKRVQEIYAIAECKEMKKAVSAAKGFAGQVKEEGEIAAGIVTHPVKSITGVPKGIGHFIKRAGSSIVDHTDKGNYKSNPVTNWLQVGENKRQLAHNLRVSPYTDNPVLQDEMKGLSTASIVGGMGMRILIPGDGLLLVSKAGQEIGETESAYLDDPGDLYQQNREALEKAGVTAAAIEAFLSDKNYDPRQQTILVTAFAKLGSPKGADSFIGNATTAASGTDAHFFRRTAQLLAKFHQKKGPIDRLVDVYGFPAAISKDGILVVPLALDHAVWTERAGQFADAAMRVEFDGVKLKGRELFVTGTVSEKARAGLKDHGFTVTEKAFQSLR